MRLFDGLRRARAVARADEALRAGGDAALESLDAKGLVALADRLADRGELDGARRVAREALRRVPEDWDATAALAHLEEASGHPEEAIRLLRTLAQRDPSHEAVARTLAELLTAAGEPAEGAALLERFASSRYLQTHVARGRALFAAGKASAAVEALAPVVREWERNPADPFQQLGTQFGMEADEGLELKQLYEAALAESEGAEQLVVDAAERGQLVARSGVNYRLLATSLMVKSGRIAPNLPLYLPEVTFAIGERLLKEDARSAVGRCQLGISLLRTGDTGGAREQFQLARELDPTHFGAMCGYGATLDVEHRGLRKLARKLPDPVDLPEALRKVVPDWEALTDLERRVVLASTRAFLPHLPRLADTGRRMRILPVDVRIIDLPEFAELAEARAEDDHRAYAALNGLAGHELACVKIEELLHVEADGWAFAHELAHLAHEVLSDGTRDEIAALYAAALDRDYEVTQYQLTSEHEFFAVAYTDWLVRETELSPLPAPPGELMQEVFALIDRIAAGR